MVKVTITPRQGEARVYDMGSDYAAIKRAEDFKSATLAGAQARRIASIEITGQLSVSDQEI